MGVPHAGIRGFSGPAGTRAAASLPVLYLVRAGRQAQGGGRENSLTSPAPPCDLRLAPVTPMRAHRPARNRRLREDESQARSSLVCFRLFYQIMAPRLASDPANVHTPCGHDGGLCFPLTTFTVSFNGMTGPRRNHVHALDEREPNHRPDRITKPTRPAGLLKITDQTRDLRAVEQHSYLLSAARRCYGRFDHGRPTSWSRPPGVGASRGSPMCFCPPNCIDGV